MSNAWLAQASSVSSTQIGPEARGPEARAAGAAGVGGDEGCGAGAASRQPDGSVDDALHRAVRKSKSCPR